MCNQRVQLSPIFPFAYRVCLNDMVTDAQYNVSLPVKGSRRASRAQRRSSCPSAPRDVICTGARGLGFDWVLQNTLDVPADLGLPVRTGAEQATGLPGMSTLRNRSCPLPLEITALHHLYKHEVCRRGMVGVRTSMMHEVPRDLLPEVLKCNNSRGSSCLTKWKNSNWCWTRFAQEGMLTHGFFFLNPNLYTATRTTWHRGGHVST
jgi:hypothetical protein